MRVRTCGAYKASRLTPFLQGCVIVAALAGCDAGGDAPSAAISGARLAGETLPVLEAEVDLLWSQTMLEALDRGIPLRLRFELAAPGASPPLQARRELQLRYLPLAHRYEVRDLQTGSARSFPRRPQLLAALDRIRLPLGVEWDPLRAGGALRLDLALDHGALPGPLRLPALFSTQWRLASGEYAWRNPG